MSRSFGSGVKCAGLDFLSMAAVGSPGMLMTALRSQCRRFRHLTMHFIHRRLMRSTNRLPHLSYLCTATVLHSKRRRSAMVRLSDTSTTPVSPSAALWRVNASSIARWLLWTGGAGLRRCAFPFLLPMSCSTITAMFWMAPGASTLSAAVASGRDFIQ